MGPRAVVSLLCGVVAGLSVACNGEDLVEPVPGQVRVTTTTEGPVGDPDGYTLAIDGEAPSRIGASGSVLLDVSAGEHSVMLGDIAPNCTLAGEAERPVTVASGDLIEVAFAITCGPVPGGLSVTTSTTGDLLDPDGYAVRIDGGDLQAIGLNETLAFPGLPPGPHQVELVGTADNCGVEGENPVAVEIVEAAPAQVEFQVVCRAGVARWLPISSGTTADFTSVWSPGDGTAFVCGERDTDRGVEGVILGYDGERWVTQVRKGDFRPRALWGTAPDDVYAVGYGFFAALTTVLRYDGSEWTPVLELGRENGEDLGFESIWGSTAEDIFAVGAAFDGPIGSSLIYHYDGSAWGRMTVEGPVSPVLSDVYGFSAADVYAVGRDQVADPSVGVVLHYDGAGWTPVLAVERLTLNAVWGSSPADVYAVGFQVEERGEDFLVYGSIWHYDGAGWSAVVLPAVGVLHEVWGTSASDVYAVGDDGVIVRYDGSQWTATNEAPATLLGVWGSAPGEVIAAGIGGTLLLGTP